MRVKLLGLILVTTVVALIVTGVALLRHDLGVYRRSWALDLTTQAELLGLASAPALAFDDARILDRNLAELHGKPGILVVAIYRADGLVYRQYARDKEAAPTRLQPPSEQHTRILGESVEVFQPVFQHGERLGTIYLRGRYDIIGRMRAYSAILASAALLSLAVAVCLASIFQRIITRPLEAIANVARRVVQDRDFTLRAPQQTHDELGVVVSAFNKMLDEVEVRTRALEESNRVLRQEASSRAAAEAALRASERLYRAVGESINYGVWVTDADGRCTYVSESLLRLIGKTQSQCAEFGWLDALHPEDRHDTHQAWRDCVQSGSIWYREHRFLGADGSYHHVLAQGVPVTSEDGKITGWAGINLDISRMKETEDALRETDRRKDEFLAVLAHELRNPLAPIRYAVQLLDLPAADERRRRWGHDVIARQVQRMALLLDDLLDVSRITRGRLELHRERVDLNAIVSAAVETARPLIESKEHRLQLELPDQPLCLDVDPLRISQALSNLLTNAAKYTDPGGSIGLRVILGDGGLIFAVRDTGVGLSATALPRLFQMFSQLDQSKDRTEGGLGIGLALVKGLVELHGGTVGAESAGPGLGSTFQIILPRTTVVAESAAKAALALTERTAAEAGFTVLVADDNADTAETLAEILRCDGHAVTTAYNGQSALDTALRLRPEAVVLDVGMPGLTGHEVARRIREQFWGKASLLIAVTGWGKPQDRDQAIVAGFDYHLTKPVEARDIRELLRSRREARGASVQGGSERNS